MAHRFLLLVVFLFLFTSSPYPNSLFAQTNPVPSPIQIVTVRTSVSHLDPKTGKSDILSAPSVSTPSGSEARVTVAGRPDPKDPKGKPEKSMELIISPTVQPDGKITISLRVSISTKTEPIDPKSDKRERKRESKMNDGTLVFYSFLGKDGLYSIQDSRNNRRWYKLGAVVEGWKLESFNSEANTLKVSQGATVQELQLYKSTVEASASELSTVVTLLPGEVVKVPGVGGLEVSVAASVSTAPASPAPTTSPSSIIR